MAQFSPEMPEIRGQGCSKIVNCGRFENGQLEMMGLPLRRFLMEFVQVAAWAPGIFGSAQVILMPSHG